MLDSAFAEACGYNVQQMMSYFSCEEIACCVRVVFCISLFIYKDDAKIVQAWRKSVNIGVLLTVAGPFSTVLMENFPLSFFIFCAKAMSSELCSRMPSLFT